MFAQTSLKSKRLLLRPFELSDATRVHSIVNNKHIADVTANIPYPYPNGLAEKWIATHDEEWQAGRLVAFAITLIENNSLIGCISLSDMDKNNANLGYWIGEDYWKKGYCTEACISIIEYGKSTLKLNSIKAHHLSRNPVSGKVLEKVGFSHLGSSSGTCGFQNLIEETESYRISFNS